LDTAHGDALALAAGEGLGLALKVGVEPEHGRGLAHAGVDLGLGKFPQLQAEGHVLIYRHVRIERVVLENHRDVPVLGQHVVHHPVVDRNGAARDLLQPRDHAQGGRFPAAGRADQHHEFPILDLQIDAVDNLHIGTAGAGINFNEILDAYGGHG
jgi:hypothetical protein